MASKQNDDLFNQSSKQNEGSLPLDFAGGTGKEAEPKKEPEVKPEVKTAVSEPAKKGMAHNALAPIPHAAQYSPDNDIGRSDLNGNPRKPIHHVPPPYKKSAQEQTQSNTQEEPVKETKPVAPVVTSVQPTVKEKIPEPPKPPVVIKQKVKTPAPAPTPPVALSPEPNPVQAPATVVSAPVSMPAQTAAPAQAPVSTPAPATVVPPSQASIPVAAADPAPVQAAVTAPAPVAVPTPKPVPMQEKKEPVKLQPKLKEQKEEKKPDHKADHKSEKPHVAHAPHKKEIPPVQQAPVPSPVQPKIHEAKPVKQEEKKDIHKSKKFNVIEKFSYDNATSGQILQEGRVRMGMSIDQISGITKIKKNFIESIERDDYHNLPAPVYVNAYVRSLCYLYKIDENQVLTLLNKAKGKALEYTVPEEVIHHVEKGKQINIIQEIKVKRISLVIITACLILVAGTAVIYQLLIMNKPQTSVSVPVKTEKIADVNPNPVKSPASNSVNIQDQMEKKLVSPHVFTMSQLPLPEQH